MQRNIDTPTGLRQTLHEAVEIKLWEVYVLRSRSHLHDLLSLYSLDKGPLPQNQPDSDRVSYRFMSFDWSRTIKPFLINHSIPFDVVRNFKTDVIHPVAKKKIYLVEDDLDVLFTLNTMLEKAGYDVLMSHCGKPVMENSPATDLYILDNAMPDVDGLEICRHLRSRDETKDIPVIMISALRNIASKAKAAGANYFLEKPVPMNELLRIVSECTNQPADPSETAEKEFG